MKRAYFNCFSGAAGDMIVGALLDAGADSAALLGALGKLKLDDEIDIAIEPVSKSGIAAIQFRPTLKTHHHGHGHGHGHDHGHGRHLSGILEIIDAAGFSRRVTDCATTIFKRLGAAEAAVHGVDIEKVHFHEVGAADAMVDIVGAALCLELLGIDAVSCSPLVTGNGQIHCAHGVLPVPAPATAKLIEGVPSMGSDVQGELLTPTGAAILTTIAEAFGAMGMMQLERTGYGAGTRDIDGRANVLAVSIGTDAAQVKGPVDEVTVIETNLDDTTGELIGHAVETLMAAGALDVTCTAVQMKHNRPGTRITVICNAPDVTRLEGILFTETTTIGLRKWTCQRTVLKRDMVTVQTPYGPSM